MNHTISYGDASGLGKSIPSQYVKSNNYTHNKQYNPKVMNDSRLIDISGGNASTAMSFGKQGP